MATLDSRRQPQRTGTTILSRCLNPFISSLRRLGRRWRIRSRAYCLKLRGDSASGHRSARSATAGCSGAELVNSPLALVDRQSGRVCRLGEGDGAKADLEERFSTESRGRLLDDCYHPCPGRLNCPPSVGVRLGQIPDRGKCAKSHESRNLLAPQYIPGLECLSVGSLAYFIRLADCQPNHIDSDIRATVGKEVNCPRNAAQGAKQRVVPLDLTSLQERSNLLCKGLDRVAASTPATPSRSHDTIQEPLQCGIDSAVSERGEAWLTEEHGKTSLFREEAYGPGLLSS